MISLEFRFLPVSSQNGRLQTFACHVAPDSRKINKLDEKKSNVCVSCEVADMVFHFPFRWMERSQTNKNEK